MKNIKDGVATALIVALIVAMANAYSDIQTLNAFKDQGKRHTAGDATKEHNELMREFDKLHKAQDIMLQKLLAL